MTSAEIDQIAQWLVDHGFTVQVDHAAQRITLILGPPGALGDENSPPAG